MPKVWPESSGPPDRLATDNWGAAPLGMSVATAVIVVTVNNTVLEAVEHQAGKWPMSILCTFGFHQWKNCRCSRCFVVRDVEHRWEGCCCVECKRKRDTGHNWSVPCKCSTCGAIRIEFHMISGCTCTACKENFHEWKEIRRVRLSLAEIEPHNAYGTWGG